VNYLFPLPKHSNKTSTLRNEQNNHNSTYLLPPDPRRASSPQPATAPIMADDLKTPLVVGEIEEVDAAPKNVTPGTSEQAKHVRTKVPEVEIHLYRQSKGPVAVFKSPLGGWEQDQIEVRDILERHGLKSVFAFNPRAGGRGVPVRFNPKNGRSILAYRDGAVVYLDGDPKVCFFFFFFF